MGHIAAVQTGALVICIILMIVEEGFGTWIVGQILILPIALMTLPVGLLLRVIVGLGAAFPWPAASITGLIVGILGSAFVAESSGSVFGAIMIVSAGAFSGTLGGLAWWGVEQGFHEHSDDNQA